MFIYNKFLPLLTKSVSSSLRIPSILPSLQLSFLPLLLLLLPLFRPKSPWHNFTPPDGPWQRTTSARRKRFWWSQFNKFQLGLRSFSFSPKYPTNLLRSKNFFFFERNGHFFPLLGVTHEHLHPRARCQNNRHRQLTPPSSAPISAVSTISINFSNWQLPSGLMAGP